MCFLQQNYPYEVGSMPAWPVNATCAKLTAPYATTATPSDRALIAAAAGTTNMAFGRSSGGDCLETFAEGPGVHFFLNRLIPVHFNLNRVIPERR